MHQDGTDASNLGCLYGTQYRVSQQCRTERLALSRLVDRKSPDHHHRYRVGHIASDAARRFRVSYCANGKRVVAHHPPFYASHVCSGSATFFVLEGPSSKPVIERRLTRLELRK